MDIKKLVSEAKKALKNAYAPYSDFKVGAALISKSGKIYTGCNIENKSYGATICAERSAISKAVSDGEREFSAIAVASSANKPTSPCGICRQVLCEFSPDMKIIVCGDDDGYIIYTASELLPADSIPLK